MSRVIVKILYFTNSKNQQNRYESSYNTIHVTLHSRGEKEGIRVKDRIQKKLSITKSRERLTTVDFATKSLYK